MNITDAKNEYIAWKATYASRASAVYPIWLNRFIEINTDRSIESYGIKEIIKFKNWLDDKQYSPTTTQFAMIVLHNFFKFHRLQGVDCLSPELIRVKRFQGKSHRAITEEEFRKTLEVIDNDFIGLRNKLIVSLLWDSGIRVSELCSLDVDQFRIDSRKTVVATRKNGKNRIIMWSEHTHGLLYQYIPLRSILTATAPLLIGSIDKKPCRLSTRSIQRIITYYAKKAEILDKVTPHSYRHGWAHHRRDKYNAPLAFIQKGLGHNSPISTFVYEQYSDREFENQAQAYL